MRRSIVCCATASLRCCARAGLLAALLGIALWACSDNGTDNGGDPNNGAEPTILRVAGVVAVGDRVANAEVTVVCGDYHPTLNAGYRAVTGGGESNDDAVGSYEITIADSAYAAQCRRRGVRARADFRLESDDDANRKLVAGVGAVDGRAERMTLNINPFTDIAVRMALIGADLAADNAWMSAQPSADEWRAMVANGERIAELTASGADFFAGQFDQPMDDLLERYWIASSPGANGVRFGAHRALPTGPSVGTPTQPADVVELAAENGVIRAPTRAERDAIARIREAAAAIALPDYRQRIVDNLGQFDDKIAEQTETVEFIAISGVSANVYRALSLAELGLSDEEVATWRARSADGAGVRAFVIADKKVGLEIAPGMRGERHFRVAFNTEDGIKERFYTVLLLAEPAITPIEIDAQEQQETTYTPRIADPDGIIISYALRGAPVFVTVDSASGELQITPDYGAVLTGASKNYIFALVAHGRRNVVTTPVVVSVANSPAPTETQRAITDTITGSVEDIPRILLRHELIETSQGAVWRIVGAAAEAGGALRVGHSEDRITVTSPNTVGTQRFSVMFRADATTVTYDYTIDVAQRDEVRITPLRHTASSGMRAEIPIAVTDPRRRTDRRRNGIIARQS